MSRRAVELQTASIPIARIHRLVRRPLETLDAVLTGRDLVRLRLGPKTVYLVNEPDLIAEVLGGDRAVFARQGIERTTERLLAGDSVATLDGDAHSRRWEIVEAVFTGGASEVAVQRILACARQASERWRDGSQVHLEREMARLTDDVMCSLTFGDDAEALAAPTSRLIALSRQVALRAANPIAPLLWRLPLPVNRRFRDAYTAFRDAVSELIVRRRAAATPGDDLLGRLIAARSPGGESLTDIQIRDEAWTYVAQGAPTYALLWAWWMLARNPHAAGAVHAELDALGDGPVTAEDLPRLEQTRAFVLETLRLFPTSLGALRRTGRPAELGGVSVPPERLVLISYWTTQRDGRYWPEPTRFELGRWLGGGEREHGGVYLPFSAGHRRCPARSLSMTMLTLVVATLAKAWEAEPLRASVSLGVVPFIHPRGGLRARLKSRRAG